MLWWFQKVTRNIQSDPCISTWTKMEGWQPEKKNIMFFFNVERLSSINSLDHEDKVNIVVVGKIYRCEKNMKLRFLTMFTNDNTKFKPCTITRLPIVAATVLGGSESRSLHTRTPRKGKARHYHCVTEFQIMTSRHHAMKNFHANPVFCLRKTTQWISGSLHVRFQACFLSRLQPATWSVPIQITKVPSEFHHKCSSIPSNQNPPVEPFFLWNGSNKNSRPPCTHPLDNGVSPVNRRSWRRRRWS